jgi:hypothetical protein
MQNMYYFSQGRLIHNVPNKKFVDPKGMNEANETNDKHSGNSKTKDNGYNIFNFQIFYPSRLRYKL